MHGWIDRERVACYHPFFILFSAKTWTFVSFKLMGATLQYVAEILKFNLGFKMNHSKTLGKYHTHLNNPPSNLCAESRPCISGDYK